MNGPTTRYVQRRQACIHTVWAAPRSLATTSGISDLISFPRGTEMFQFPPLATLSLCIQPRATWVYAHVGFPIRRSTGQRLYTAHRRLSQFYHVLHRLLVPRHPPNALTSLTTETFALSIGLEVALDNATSSRSGRWPSHHAIAVSHQSRFFIVSFDFLK